MKIDMNQLHKIVTEWVGDANLSVQKWDKGTYGRVYVKSHGKRQYSGFVDTDGRVDFFWAYFRPQHSLGFNTLCDVAKRHGIEGLVEV